MSKQSTWYYECHITMRGKPADIKPRVEVVEGHWKFSAIDGDPSLGDGVLCYATRHYNGKILRARVIELMNKTADDLRAYGCEVIRQKVELVVYDTKKREAA